MTLSDRGISLVEMLGTLVILGAMFAMLAGTTGMARRVWERGDVQDAAASDVVGAQNMLRARIERAFPQSRFDASAPYVDFQGEAASLTFLAPAPDNMGIQPLRRYTLSLSPEGDVVVASQSDLALQDRPAITTETVLRRVAGLSISYFDNAQKSWLLRWPDKPALPALVRLQVRFNDGDRRLWPDLIIHPAATMDSQCQVDSATGRCRGRL